MTCPWCRMFIVSLVAVTDVAVYIYEHYNKGNNPNQISVSYPAHISGAMAGLLIGITCLKNLRWERHERYIWLVSVIVFALLIGSAMIFSISNPSYFAAATQSRTIYNYVNCSMLPVVL
jgi:peptidoglycan/LPS O-acetylase OafA/YrhL